MGCVCTSSRAGESSEPDNASTCFLGSFSEWESELLHLSHKSEGNGGEKRDRDLGNSMARLCRHVCHVYIRDSCFLGPSISQ